MLVVSHCSAEGLRGRRVPDRREPRGIIRELGNELIAGAPATPPRAGRIRRRPRFGGLLNYYHRAA